LTFLAMPRLSAAVPAGHVDLDSNVDFMDHAAFDAIHAWRAGYESCGGRVDIDEIPEEWSVSAAAGTPVPESKSSVARLPRWSMPWSVRHGSTAAARPGLGR
jgi:carbonic anhydrase